MDESQYQKMMPVFLAEAEDRLAAMQRSIELLAADAFDRGAREEMARAAHTIRGNAAALGLKVMTEQAGRLERWAMLPPTEAPDWMIAELRRACGSLRDMLAEIGADHTAAVA